MSDYFDPRRVSPEWVAMAHALLQLLAQSESDFERAYRESMEARIRQLEAELTRLREEIDRLAEFIMEEVPGEPSQSEGAVDTAIRLLRQRDDLLAALRAAFRFMKDQGYDFAPPEEYTEQSDDWLIATAYRAIAEVEGKS